MSSPIESLPTRSLMFVPGSKQRMIAKSVTMINLDLAIYDIEDGVAPQEKPLARKLIGDPLTPAPLPLRGVPAPGFTSIHWGATPLGADQCRGIRGRAHRCRPRVDRTRSRWRR